MPAAERRGLLLFLRDRTYMKTYAARTMTSLVAKQRIIAPATETHPESPANLGKQYDGAVIPLSPITLHTLT